jgi:hypothetical protein
MSSVRSWLRIRITRPAYFHGGQALEKAGRLEEARAMYEEGIAVTARTGDAHTRSELQAALDIL